MFNFIPRSSFISDKNDSSSPLLYNEHLLLLFSNSSWSTLLCLLWAAGQRFQNAECISLIGCSASIDHIRCHGSFWATHRQAINELDASTFWRASIDNLNFNCQKSLRSTGPRGQKKCSTRSQVK